MIIMRDPELADAGWAVTVRLRLPEPIPESAVISVLRRLRSNRHGALSAGRDRAEISVDDGFGVRRSLIARVFTLAPSAPVAGDVVTAEIRGVCWLLEIDVDNVVEIHARPWDETDDDDEAGQSRDDGLG